AVCSSGAYRPPRRFYPRHNLDRCQGSWQPRSWWQRSTQAPPPLAEERVSLSWALLFVRCRLKRVATNHTQSGQLPNANVDSQYRCRPSACQLVLQTYLMSWSSDKMQFPPKYGVTDPNTEN